MIEVNWQNDGRANMPDKYTFQWNDNKGRLSAFLGGWTDWARNNRHKRGVVHWRTMGALYASAFGSREAAAQVPETVRCELYHVALITPPRERPMRAARTRGTNTTVSAPRMVNANAHPNAR